MAGRRASVGFAELQPTFPNIGSFLICPTYGLVLLATMVRNLGYSVSVMVEGATKFSIEDLQRFDLVCFSVKSASANKTYSMADELRRRGKKVIFGGTHATYFPEDCLAHGDYAVRGEGDDVLPALLECIENDGDPALIKGLSYIKGGKVWHTKDLTPPRNLTIAADHSLVANIGRWGAGGSFLRAKRVMLPVQSSRGCPHKCSFCAVTKMFGSSYRKREVGVVISEIESALRYTKNIHFVDNNFVGSSNVDVDHTARLLEAIISKNLGIVASVFVTIDVANKIELLNLMRRAGIRVLMIGFESMDQKSLACYHKEQKASEMKRNTEVLKDCGFTILGSFMAGSNGEDGHAILRTARLAAEWRIDELYYFLLSPYPDMGHIVSPRRVFLKNWDFATGNHVYFFPKNASASDLQKAIGKANRVFYSFRRIMRFLLKRDLNSAKELFLRRILFARIERAIKRNYIPFLQRLDTDLYRNGRLDEDVLSARTIDKLKYWNVASKHV